MAATTGATPGASVSVARGFTAARWIGETGPTGMEVKSRQVDAGHLFHTYLTALGVKSTGHFMVAGQKLPMADPAFEPIDELVA